MGQVAFRETLYTLHCARCGVQFGFTNDYEDRRRKDGAEFYCPSGHPNYYTVGESDAKKIKRLEAEAKREREAKESARAETEAARRVNRALRGQATKMRKRIAAGVCPCCTRSFADLGAHMTQKHPGYAATEVGA